MPTPPTFLKEKKKKPLNLKGKNNLQICRVLQSCSCSSFSSNRDIIRLLCSPEIFNYGQRKYEVQLNLQQFHFPIWILVSVSERKNSELNFSVIKYTNLSENNNWQIYETITSSTWSTITYIPRLKDCQLIRPNHNFWSEYENCYLLSPPNYIGLLPTIHIAANRIENSRARSLNWFRMAINITY